MLKDIPPQIFSHGSVPLFCRHQLETPGKYTQLEAFYEDKKGILPGSDSSLLISDIPSSPSSLDGTDLRVSTH